MLQMLRVLSVVLWLFVVWSWGTCAQAGQELAVYGELPLNQGIGIPLDRGNGPGHGIVFYQYTDQKHVGKGNQLRAGLNTDTVWLAWDIGATSGRPLVLSPYLKGQFGFGEMTPDYIRAGRFIEELSFFSMYAEVGLDLRWKLVPTLFLVGRVSFRYWFFFHRGEASKKAGLILPANSPAARSAISLVWNAMDTHVARGRLRQGFRAKATIALRRRFVQRSWGGFKTSLEDKRNTGFYSQPNIRMTAQAEGSVCVHPRICVGLELQGGGGWFADDLNRFKLGGDNDYVPMVSGTYFAEFVTDSFILSHFRLVFLPWMWWRITPQVDIAWITDPLRVGKAKDSRLVLGLGLNLDFFIRDNMRIHIKLAYSPNAPRPERDGGVKLMLGYVANWW